MKINYTFRDKKHFLEMMIKFAEKWDWSKPLVVKLDELRRLEIQSQKFHAMLADISESGMEWNGKARTPKEWKVLIVSGHTIATKNDVEMVIGLEGELVNIRESTSGMTIRRMASLIEYCYAWARSNDIVFDEPVIDYSDYHEVINARHK
jgi:hypothetical protein